MMSESEPPPEMSTKKPLSIGATFIVIYGLCLIILFAVPFLSVPITDFSGRTLREFTIAGVATNADKTDSPYRVLTLEQFRSPDSDFSDLTFLLPIPSVTINVGDIHRAEVLEHADDSQLIAFHYSNSRTSVSVYRAFEKTIEPVSHKVTSDVGQGFSAVLLFIPALIISAIIASAYNWVAHRRAEKNENFT
jgi:hypothetical protein